MNRLTRVLVADDEPAILFFLKLKLRASGYDVMTVPSGEEALEQVKARAPDLMVLDLIMPGKDGYQTLEELRTFSDMPVIVLSARGEEARPKSLQLGANDFIAKPFDPDELVVAVRRLIEGSILTNHR